jgi:oxygen-independent coproporphyrinogen-3 oxidase
VQRAIGRWQPLGLIERAVDGLRGAGVTSLNFDLMYGLPYQGLAEIGTTLDAVLKLRPERIALFGYAHVPHLIPRQRRIDSTALPGAELRFAQAELGDRILTGAGYRPIGFDHYALPNDPLALAAAEGGLHRNFQGFTDDGAETLIGLGASAISQFPGLLAQNEKNAGRYRMQACAGLLPTDRGVRRTHDDRRRAAAVERLLCDGRADVSGLLDPALIDRLRPFLDRGLAELAGTSLNLLPGAKPYARVVASLLDTYRQPSKQRFSSAI